MFCHSLRSCWNNGNAHFLRGVVSALVALGHRVKVYEPVDSWSAHNLVREEGADMLEAYRTWYPALANVAYDAQTLDLDEATADAQLVLVHEWNAPELVAALGSLRARRRDFRLLFHDTHHRAATAPDEMAAYDLRDYDGVLAFGSVIRDLYLERGWTSQAWTWHEAADAERFRPLLVGGEGGDLVWVGNWGDDERTDELREFLLDPVWHLQLRAKLFGVRYPSWALDTLVARGIGFGGWLPNHGVPEIFSQYRMTVHVPRRPYASQLPGIPTIRVFEALACGIPLVTGPWEDSEHLFRVGTDFLMARNGRQMCELMREVLNDPALGVALAVAGLETVLSRHTCRHRALELVELVQKLDASHKLGPPLERSVAQL